MRVALEDMSPRQIVSELDKYIIGQEKAKKAVAIAIRNRTRRQRLSVELKDEVAPKNIILIGPTGVGKTEIARRISKLSGAPFIKVEATKYTEVGYVGRDVESMVRDLMHVGVNMVRQELQESVRPEAEARAEEALLDLLLGLKKEEQRSGQGAGGSIFGLNLGQMAAGIIQQITPQGSSQPTPALGQGSQTQGQDDQSQATASKDPEDEARSQRVRERMREKLRSGELEEREVEIMVGGSHGPSIEVFSGSNMEELDLNLGGLSNILGGRKKKKTLTVKLARTILIQDELDRLVDTDRIAELARDRVQNMGIIFIDEIDKIASRSSGHGAEVSREGVQRDILPIVEGSQVNTKYGLIDTRHILFIAAGAFHTAKPSDLIPELQGRFPIRVELESLSEQDFRRILTQPANSITKQYIALLATEGVELNFTQEALELLAELAAEVNSRTENIGARRLQTVMELLLEDISFEASERRGETITIGPDYVQTKLASTVRDQDVSRYIL